MPSLLYPRNNIAVHYQSNGLPLQSWLDQLTLCFAPYAAHILIGVPKFVALRDGYAPGWKDMINFYNPTTIIYRYVMIFDRRLRAGTWSPQNMAATSAVFWTGSRWHGSENFMVLSKEWILRPPYSTRISPLSISAIGTLIVFVQGVQALYDLMYQIKTGVSLIQGLGGVFMPLALFGLFRMFPAVWLSDEFAYRIYPPESHEARVLELYDQDDQAVQGAARVSRNEIMLTDVSVDRPEEIYHQDDQAFKGSATVSHNELTLREIVVGPERPNILPATIKSWKANLWRFFIVITFLLMIVMGIGHLLTNHALNSNFNLSILVTHFLYQILVAVTLGIYLTFLFQGRADSTVIPCIDSYWYTAYTMLWYTAVLVVIIINALETRRTSCGVYTTYPANAGLDSKMCAEFAG